MAWVTWRQHRLTLGRGRGVARSSGRVPADHGPGRCTPLQRGDRLPPGKLKYLQPGRGQLLEFVRARRRGDTRPFSGDPRADRSVRRRAAAREGVRERNLSVHVDPGLGRARWTVAKLIPLAVAVTVGAGAFSVLVSWYIQPIFGAGDNNGPLYPTLFDLLGVALAAWTLTAFAIGVMAGVLIRRVIPAIFATIAVWAGLAFATGGYLRAHYTAPLVSTKATIPVQALVINQGWFRGGNPASLEMINNTLARVDVRAVTPELFQPGPSTPVNLGDPVQYLIRHGYTQLTTYQPAGPVLAVPVDRRRLAPRAFPAPRRRDGLAGPPPRSVRARAVRRE